MKTIGIDLTPLLPGGDNGGAKIMTLELIKAFFKLSPDDHFILFTSKKNKKELEPLQSNHVHIKYIHRKHPFIIFFRLLLILTKPFKMKSLTSFYNTLYYQLCIKHFRPIDLLFCPFAKPFYSFKNTPIVSVIHDLQFMDYPSFFSEKERKERKNNMDEACRHATQFICISHFVKETILKYYPSCKQKINVIYITLENRFSHAIPDNEDSILHDLSLSKNNYLFYPANFWPHKNHSMLFSAFDHYRKKHPHSSLKLVCTGSSNQTKKEYQTLIQAMGLSSWIIFPGYLSDTTFFSLFKHARAIIYPSLYEGFGMPILEAMENGKPVLCSRVTSLPEIAGDAALFFNPTHLEEMIEAISKTEDPALMETLIVRGKKRAHFLKTQTQMAKEYWAIFKEVLN